MGCKNEALKGFALLTLQSLDTDFPGAHRTTQHT